MSDERRVTNRVSENTVINADNALQFFDGDLGISRIDANVFHNGEQLEAGTHYDFVESQDPSSGDKSLSIKLKIQLQPNDRFHIE